MVNIAVIVFPSDHVTLHSLHIYILHVYICHIIGIYSYEFMPGYVCWYWPRRSISGPYGSPFPPPPPHGKRQIWKASGDIEKRQRQRMANGVANGVRYSMFATLFAIHSGIRRSPRHTPRRFLLIFSNARYPGCIPTRRDVL